MLAAAVVTSAFGQAAAPAASAAHDGSESAAFVPDFSGLWVHPLPGFEPAVVGSLEQACAENIQWYPGKDADVPRADNPDF
jgi:hypothetical protein